MVGINSILILDLFPLEIEVSGKNSLVFHELKRES